MRHFPSESVDLIYADPPFYSNKPYEVIWNDGAEIRSFDDRWKGGINHYIEWMEARISECQRVLKKTGTIYLHCDTHASHHLRLMLDKLFHENNFVSELYWYYYNKMHDYRKKVWPKATDTILMYAKDRDSDYVFHMIEENRDKPVKQLLRKKVEGKMVNVKDENGHVTYRVREKRIVDNVWRISMLQPADRTERLGYPTQKPEALLERIIEASSNPRDVVLDPFCGCGTAIAVAQKKGRLWIGIDVSSTACRVMKDRMTGLGANPRMVGMPVALDDLHRLPHFAFQDWIIERLFGRKSDRKSSDGGIDGYTQEGYPVQVKRSDGVGRNTVDNFETAIRRRQSINGVIVAFSFTKDAYEESSRARQEDHINVELLTVTELLERTKQQIEREEPSLPDDSRLPVGT